MIHLELQPEIEASLLAQANSEGLPPERYIEQLVIAARPKQVNQQSISQAFEAFAEIRKRSIRGPESLQELITEGRKY